MADHEIRVFLEELSAVEMRRVLDNPIFRQMVLESAAESEQVSVTVDQILDAEFEAMSPDKQRRIEGLARSIAAKYRR